MTSLEVGFFISVYFGFYHLIKISLWCNFLSYLKREFCPKFLNICTWDYDIFFWIWLLGLWWVTFHTINLLLHLVSRHLNSYKIHSVDNIISCKCCTLPCTNHQTSWSMCCNEYYDTPWFYIVYHASPCISRFFWFSLKPCCYSCTFT